MSPVQLVPDEAIGVWKWPMSDMPVRHSNVCFQGVERTSTQTRRMSANDPERTSAQSSSRTNCNPFFVCRAAMLSSLLAHRPYRGHIARPKFIRFRDDSEGDIMIDEKKLQQFLGKMTILALR